MIKLQKPSKIASFIPFFTQYPMSDLWISTKQAAELLGVSQRTIQNWVDDGKLKSSKTAGGHRRLNPEEVRKLLQDQHFGDTFSNQRDTNISNQVNDDLLRILLVEDDVNILRLCELRFSQFTVPHKLYMANNGYQGLIMAGLVRPHLILSDLKMPQIDGLKMISEIMKIPEMADTHIVVITGLEVREIMAMGKLPEGLTILPKPIPFATVETILYQQALQLKLPISSDEQDSAAEQNK